MAKSLDKILEEDFADFGELKWRDMFGVMGLYAGQDMFALVTPDTFFVKADDALRDELEGKGGKAFVWTDPETGREVTLSFVSVPEPQASDKASRQSIARKALSIVEGLRREKVKSPRRFSL